MPKRGNINFSMKTTFSFRVKKIVEEPILGLKPKLYSTGHTSDLGDWVNTLETDTEILTSLVSSTRLRPKIKILKSRGRDFFLAFLRPRLKFSYFRDQDLDESQNRD